MKSQYLGSYKSHVTESLKNNQRPYSVQTFLKYRLKGKAKDYSGRYLVSLVRGLESDGWIIGESKLGGMAYYPCN